MLPFSLTRVIHSLPERVSFRQVFRILTIGKTENMIKEIDFIEFCRTSDNRFSRKKGVFPKLLNQSTRREGKTLSLE